MDHDATATPGEYNPPNNAFYTQVLIPDEINPAILIGRAGFYLKRITQRSGAQYIWYDRERKVVEVWGPEHSLPLAVHLINKQIIKTALFFRP